MDHIRSDTLYLCHCQRCICCCFFCWWSFFLVKNGVSVIHIRKIYRYLRYLLNLYYFLMSYCVPDKMPFYENTIISPFKERINGAIDSICAQNKGINYLLIGANFNFQHYAYGKIWMWSFMCPCYKLGAWILWPKKAILDPFSFG